MIQANSSLDMKLAESSGQGFCNEINKVIMMAISTCTMTCCRRDLEYGRSNMRPVTQTELKTRPASTRY